MTSVRQKLLEMHDVRAAAALLGAEWTIVGSDSEAPDFLIVTPQPLWSDSKIRDGIRVTH